MRGLGWLGLGAVIGAVAAKAASTERGPGHVKGSITINKPLDEVSGAWRESEGEIVRFVPAPGDRGTEVHVERRRAAKLFGPSPAAQLHDDLRRFKQVLETGEVARSEGSPRGESLVQHLLQRPAKPRDLVGGGSR
jgi:uncharacterized membrane protein